MSTDLSRFFLGKLEKKCSILITYSSLWLYRTVYTVCIETVYSRVHTHHSTHQSIESMYFDVYSAEYCAAVHLPARYCTYCCTVLYVSSIRRSNSHWCSSSLHSLRTRFEVQFVHMIFTVSSLGLIRTSNKNMPEL